MSPPAIGETGVIQVNAAFMLAKLAFPLKVSR